MNLLVVAATQAEIGPFIAHIGNNAYPSMRLNVLITGVGMLATSYALTKHLHGRRYDLVLQVGVAGSYDTAIGLGEVVFVASDRYGDLGAEDHDDYIDIFDMGLIDKNVSPHNDGKLLSAMSPVIHLPQVSGLTVNTVSGNADTIKKRITRYNCQVESMEGAAFHYVCLREGIAFAQVRSISNYVTPRDKSQWKMKEAIISLNNWLIDFIAKQ